MSRPMTSDRLRELEWAVAYLQQTPPRRCRCAGTCPRCSEHREQAAKVSAETFRELIDAVWAEKARKEGGQ